MLNALPYVLLILFCGFLAGLRHRIQDTEKVLLTDVLCVIVFVWFLGFRGFVFYDWTSYFSEFQALPNLKTLFCINISKWTWEPGFTLIALLCKSIYNNFQFFVFFTCCINTILLVSFLKRYNSNLPLGLMIYLSVGGLVMSTDLMRNSLSILLFANALPFIVEKRPLPYFATCLLCFSVHSSSLFFFPLYFFLNRNIGKKVLLTLFVISNIIYVGHIPILKPIILLFVDILMPSTKLWIDQYLEMDAPASFLSIGYIERLLSGGLLFAYMDKLRAMRKESNIFINSMVLYLCLFLCLSEFRTISVRCSTIFSYAYWVLWIDFIRCFAIKNNKRLYICFLVVYCVAKTIGNCHSEIASYYNILFTNHTYQERLINFRRHFNDP